MAARNVVIKPSVMVKQIVIVVMWVLLSVILAVQVAAQDASTSEPQMVEVTAEDGLTLVGHYYALPSDAVAAEGAPAVLLLHGHTGTHTDWSPLIEPLLRAGYHALAVEERGLGSGWKQDWLTAVGDVQSWLDWLKGQPGIRADSLAVVGARIGAHLAINGCSNDSACFAVVALSPGCVRSEAPNCLDGYNTIPKLKEVSELTAAVVESRSAPPIFIAVSQSNPGFTDSAKTLATLSQREFSLWFYLGSYEGIGLLLSGEEGLIERAIEWLDAHAPTIAQSASTDTSSWECPAPDAVFITEYPIPTADSEPSGITVGPDGAVWFGEDVGSIGRITVDGEITEYPLPDAHYARRFPVAGPDGAVWFTDPVPNVIGRITPEGDIPTYAIPSGVERYDEDLNLTFTSSYPVGIALGADQAFWFTELDTSQIGRLSTDGEFTEYPTPTADSGPVGITLGPDGAIWFIERTANQIGRITTDGEITEYPVPTPESFLLRITGGPDGAVWFTEFNGNKIGRLSMDGEFTEFVLPTAESGPVGITAGSDTAIWFTEYNANKIGCITPEGEITEYEIPTPDSVPFNIAIGADGAVWFTENARSKIGRLQVQTAQTTFSPTSFTFPLSLTHNLDWYVSEDYSDVLTLRPFDNPSVDLAFLTLENATIADSEAPYSPVPFPDDFVTWIQSHGLFQVDSTRPVLIDGLDGTEINVTATSGCGTKTNWIFFSRTGWNCREGEFMRFIYLNDVHGEPILILITGGSLSGENFDTGLSAVQAILDSAAFSE